MSGTVCFNNAVIWSMSGWCYRTARDGIIEALRGMPECIDLAEELSTESHPAQWLQNLALEDIPQEKKQLFFKAIYQCADRFAREGAIGWNDPSVFPGFLSALEELVNMARKFEGEIA